MEDKFLKNMVATEFVYNYIKDKRTVGVIREFPERGLVEVAEPIGVIFSLTPITNPLPPFSSSASWPSRRGTR
jgi:acetaldehyde dehydrogenase / alcohol dehydrogenase